MPTFVPVQPPPAVVPLHSLVRSANTTLDGEEGWERGLAYLPEAVGGYLSLAGCSAAEEDHQLNLPPVVEYVPWELQIEEPCHTTFAYNEAEVSARLERVANAIESYAIARELMTGELAKADAAAGGDMGVNLYLAKAPTVLNGGVAASPARAIGLLEEAVGDALHGQQATIHVPRAARPYLWQTGTQQQGYLYLTSIGSLLISDAGYANTPPDGTAAADGVGWIYATGPVVVRRSALFMDAVAPGQTVDTTTNTITRKANKRVAAHFDTRAQFAVPVTLS